MPDNLEATLTPVDNTVALDNLQCAMPGLSREPFNRRKACRHGEFVYNPNDIYIGGSMDAYGEFSEREVKFLCGMLNPGDFVIEVGANIGAITVPLAKAVRHGAVIAFEPQRLVFQCLCANLALNSIENVTALQMAVADREGAARFPVFEPRQKVNLGGIGLGLNPAIGELVQVCRLDSLTLPAPALLKIDVEGFELAVLKGACALIRRHRPLLYVEADRAHLAGPLAQYLREQDYELWWHLPPLYSPDNFFQNADNQFGETVSVNFICVPNERSGQVNFSCEPVTPVGY